jgi:mono/diheme cytochrome c family protein
MKSRVAICIPVLFVLVGQCACRKHSHTANADPLLSAYDIETDWADAQRIIPLDYGQAQGKQVFYRNCVWCHADATPAGPSNRSNLTPVPPLLNDGSVLNAESDEYLQNVISLGGAAMGKSAMMPPYGRTLSAEEIRSVIAFTRAIAQPLYRAPARSARQGSAK